MGVVFGMFSFLADGFINFLDKFLLSKYDIEPTVITIYSGFMATVASIAIILFSGLQPVSLSSVLIIISSGFLTQMFLLPYFKALSLDETSRVAPLFQFTPIIVIIIGTVFLQETFTVKQYIGAGLVIIAGFLISLKALEIKSLQLRPAFYYMVLASFCSAMGILLFKLGVEDIGFFAVLPYEGFGIGIGGLAILLYPGNYKKVVKSAKKLPKKVFLLLSIEEVCILTARYMRYFAVSLLATGLVSVLSGFQGLFVFIFGIFLSHFFPHIIKESVEGRVLLVKTLSICIMFLGLYLLFL